MPAQSDVDLATLKAKGLPMTDAEELLPVCFRCGATNNLAGFAVGQRFSTYMPL